MSKFPWWRRPWWHVLHFLCCLYFYPMYRYRAYGKTNIPKTGPLLIVSNHQSFFDPIILGMGVVKRPFWALARKTLFNDPRFSWLIRSLNAIPVDQEAGDMKSMRACIEVLKAGRALIVYPEGSRTLTGKTDAFAPGTMMLIKRGKPMVLPAAIEGAFDVYPRGGKPKPTGHIRVKFGKPISADELLAMGNEKALAYLRDRVESMRVELASKLAR